MTFHHRRKRHSLLVSFLLISLLVGLLPSSVWATNRKLYPHYVDDDWKAFFPGLR